MESPNTLGITPDKINQHDFPEDPFGANDLVLPDFNDPEALLNSGFELPPALRKLLKKKIHKQRMEDFRNGKLKKGTENESN